MHSHLSTQRLSQCPRGAPSAAAALFLQVAYQQQQPAYIPLRWPSQQLSGLKQLRSLAFSGDCCIISGLEQVGRQLHILLLMGNVLLRPEIKLVQRRSSSDSSSDGSASENSSGSDGGSNQRSSEVHADFSCPELAGQLTAMQSLRWLVTERFEPAAGRLAAAAAPGANSKTAAAVGTAEFLLPALQGLSAISLPPPGVLCPTNFTSFSQLLPCAAETAPAASGRGAARQAAAESEENEELAVAWENTDSTTGASHMLQQGSGLTSLRMLSCSITLPVLQQLLPHWRQLTQLEVNLEPPGAAADSAGIQNPQQPQQSGWKSRALDFSSASTQLQHLTLKLKQPLLLHMLQQRQQREGLERPSRAGPEMLALQQNYSQLLLIGLPVQQLTHLSLSGTQWVQLGMLRARGGAWAQLNVLILRP